MNLPNLLGLNPGLMLPTASQAWTITEKNVAAELKRFIIGRALRTEQAAHERLTKKTALAVFSSDALSSTAYATEEILLVLAVAAAYGQTGAFKYVVRSLSGLGFCL
jgi:hypothetical protein